VKYFWAVVFVGVCLVFQSGTAFVEAEASKTFFLEDVRENQWCAFESETTWRAAVQSTGAMTVGTIEYSGDHLSQIDVTETDESGDWTVYDHYFLDNRAQIIKLSRLVNVLPGDRSVLEDFAIGDRKARKTGTTAKQLSTGRPLTSPEPVWLPDLPVETRTKMFPFSALFGSPGLKTANRTCVQTAGSQ
jgi:hypothetical protein